jgi:hypothetical protein
MPLVSFAAISRVVGGIEVMSVELIAVLGRTDAIWIRRTIGAQAHDISQQFPSLRYGATRTYCRGFRLTRPRGARGRVSVRAMETCNCNDANG